MHIIPTDLFHIERILLLLILLSFSLAGFAQRTYQTKYWDYDNGLPTKTSFDDIFQSEDGYLLCASDVGAVRFDGLTFQLFNQANTALPVSSMNTLFEDSKNRFWYGIEGDGFGTMLGDSTLHFSGPIKDLPDFDHDIQAIEHVKVYGYNGSHIMSMSFHQFEQIFDDQLQ